MREPVNGRWPHLALEDLLAALEEELLAADEREILDAARQLGMNPAMRGSAAFLGLKYAARRTPSEWLAGFDPALLHRLGMARDAGPAPAPVAPATLIRKPSVARPKKPSSDG